MKTFREFLKEDYDDYSDLDNVDAVLKRYIDNPSIGNRAGVANNQEELLKRYGNKKKLRLYRGLNFDTKEDFDNFIDTLNDGEITISSRATSWTRDKETAEQFAQTKPSYMEYMSREKMQQISTQEKELEYVVGYRGVILEIDVDQGQGIDTSLTDFKAEDEIIITKGTFKCKYHSVLKNSDRIKQMGIQALLNEITSKVKMNNRDHTLLSKILRDHRDQLTPDMKRILAKYYLFDKPKPKLSYTIVTRDGHSYSDIRPRFHEKGTLLIDLRVPKILMTDIDLFLKSDIEQYVSEYKDEHKKVIQEVLKIVEESNYEQIVHTTNSFLQTWMDMLGMGGDYKKLHRAVGIKYNQQNKQSSIDNINKLQGKEKDKALDDLVKSMEKIFRGI